MVGSIMTLRRLAAYTVAGSDSYCRQSSVSVHCCRDLSCLHHQGDVMGCHQSSVETQKAWQNGLCIRINAAVCS
jgi:hypothetical protein